MFCLTLKPEHESLIRLLNYIPVGLGNNKFSNNFLNDKSGVNISDKNTYYGEYTFHYWIWKNYLNQIKTEWVGFCQYRKFFFTELYDESNITFDKIKKFAIKEVKNSKEFDCILGNQFYVNNYKLIKIIKNHLLKFVQNPKKIFRKNERTIKFHFDLFHGKGNLDAAIDLLDDKNREDFRKFVSTRVSFNPHNMFICKKECLTDYYETIFPWFQKCEKIFGFKDLKGYGLQRIYGFLAERFLSY